jgi:tetratricopeptide (TPR) repeat protein
MPDARELCDSAIELAEQGKYDEAILVMNSVIRTDSNNANAWYNKGVIQYKQGKYLDAVNSFGQATDIDPEFTEAWYNKGLALAALGKYPEAIHAFDKVLSINKKDKQARYQRDEALKKIIVSCQSSLETHDQTHQMKLFR